MNQITKLWHRFQYWLDQYRKVEIRYSADLTLYYVPKYADRVRYWLSVEKLPVEIKDQPCGPFDGGILVEKANGEKYCRRSYSFTFWKVKTGPTVKRSAADDLVRDFASLHPKTA